MNITEATKKALQSGRGITRPEFIKNTKYGLWFLPTKSTLGYLIIDNKEITPLWQPTANDIIANDWIVYG